MGRREPGALQSLHYVEYLTMCPGATSALQHVGGKSTLIRSHHLEVFCEVESNPSELWLCVLKVLYKSESLFKVRKFTY